MKIFHNIKCRLQKNEIHKKIITNPRIKSMRENKVDEEDVRPVSQFSCYNFYFCGLFL